MNGSEKVKKRNSKRADKVLEPYRNSKNKRVFDVTKDKKQAISCINNCSTIIQSKDGSPLEFREA